jgi:uncharacterized protein YjiS (DUF1127 family)
MSHYLDGGSVATFAESPSFSGRAFFKSVVDTLRVWHKRQCDRRQLLDYLAMDHRAASDIGIDRSNARDWAQRPFWRA